MVYCTCNLLNQSIAPQPTFWRSVLILSSHLPSDHFPSGIPIKPLYTPLLPHTCYMPSPCHSSRFDRPNNICWRLRIIKLLVMYFSPLSNYLFPLRPKYSPQHLFSNTFSLRSSLNLSDQVSHPYKTRGDIIVLCVLISVFFNRKLEYKRFCAQW